MGPELRAALRVLYDAWERNLFDWGDREPRAPSEQAAIQDAWEIVGRAIEGEVPGDK